MAIEAPWARPNGGYTHSVKGGNATTPGDLVSHSRRGQEDEYPCPLWDGDTVENLCRSSGRLRCHGRDRSHRSGRQPVLGA